MVLQWEVPGDIQKGSCHCFRNRNWIFIRKKELEISLRSNNSTVHFEAWSILKIYRYSTCLYGERSKYFATTDTSSINTYSTFAQANVLYFLGGQTDDMSSELENSLIRLLCYTALWSTICTMLMYYTFTLHLRDRRSPPPPPPPLGGGWDCNLMLRPQHPQLDQQRTPTGHGSSRTQVLAQVTVRGSLMLRRLACHRCKHADTRWLESLLKV